MTLRNTWSLGTKAAKTATMIAAAAVMTRPVLEMPSTTEARLSPVRTQASRTADMRNTS
jgi:hypothetical protein